MQDLDSRWKKRVSAAGFPFRLPPQLKTQAKRSSSDRVQRPVEKWSQAIAMVDKKGASSCCISPPQMSLDSQVREGAAAAGLLSGAEEFYPATDPRPAVGCRSYECNSTNRR